MSIKRRPRFHVFALLVLLASVLHTVSAQHLAVPIDAFSSSPISVHTIMVRFAAPFTYALRSLPRPSLTHSVLFSSPSPPSPQNHQRFPSPNSTAPSSPPTGRLPTLFVSHGGGPSFFLRDEGGPFAELGPKSASFRALQATPAQLGLSGATKPKAILIISAHWETKGAVCITSRDSYDELYYDYHGFPQYTYELNYPAPGSSALAARASHSLPQRSCGAGHAGRHAQLGPRGVHSAQGNVSGRVRACGAAVAAVLAGPRGAPQHRTGAGAAER